MTYDSDDEIINGMEQFPPMHPCGICGDEGARSAGGGGGVGRPDEGERSEGGGGRVGRPEAPAGEAPEGRDCDCLDGQDDGICEGCPECQGEPKGDPDEG